MAVPSVAWMDGEIVPVGEARVPIEDRGLQFAESLYEVIAITDGEARMLSVHAQRMRDAAEELGLAAGVPDDPTWDRIAKELCARDPVREGLLYAQVTGGEAPRSHVPKADPSPRFWAYFRDIRFPRDAEVARGIRAITMTDPRWARCDLKTTMLLPAVMAKRAAAREGAGEAIFLGPEDGLVREGASSTVFIVEDRTLTSPALSSHLLPGTTGARLARLAADAGLTVRAEDIHVDQLRSADELVVASTTLLVMPITHLDGEPIASGTTGSVARDLARRLREDLALAD
jgi:D-alanine transaminase